MQVGLGALGLAPATFWAMSLREFTIIADFCNAAPSGGPITRNELEQLIGQFPDHLTKTQR